jgi:hypothetical protein
MNHRLDCLKQQGGTDTSYRSYDDATPVPSADGKYRSSYHSEDRKNPRTLAEHESMNCDAGSLVSITTSSMSPQTLGMLRSCLDEGMPSVDTV